MSAAHLADINGRSYDQSLSSSAYRAGYINCAFVDSAHHIPTAARHKVASVKWITANHVKQAK